MRFSFGPVGPKNRRVTKPASPARSQPRGAEVLAFLRGFEGAWATFESDGHQWRLSVPAIAEPDYPLTPASQIFFGVQLNDEEHPDGGCVVRFCYECATSRVRYYTSAIPAEIQRDPRLENAMAELFRHELPVEPVRQRTISHDPVPVVKRVVAPGDLERAPVEAERAPVAVVRAESRGEPAAVVGEAVSVAPAVASPGELPPFDRRAARRVRFEIGPRAHTVLLAAIVMFGLLIFAAMGLYAYLRLAEDPGVAHHRLQLEAMKLREGR